jgi:phosphopantetheine--protein transferase-like protein
MRHEARNLLTDLDIDPRAGDDGDFGIGIDVEEVARWERPAAVLFTAAEHAHCQGLARPAESYAGRWCAKEAVLKSLTRFVMVSLRDIEIRSGPGGMPEPRLIPPADVRWPSRSTRPR